MFGRNNIATIQKWHWLGWVGWGVLRWLCKISCRWWSLINAKKTIQPHPRAFCTAKYCSIIIMYGSAVVATWHGTFTVVNSLCMIRKCAWNLNGMLNYKRTVVRTSFECMHESYLWERKKTHYILVLTIMKRFSCSTVFSRKMDSNCLIRISDLLEHVHAPNCASFACSPSFQPTSIPP